jgi:hypothetical protein
MKDDRRRSLAARVRNEAIKLAIEERSPYPERCFFIEAEMASAAGTYIREAADEGMSLVLVAADGSIRVLTPEEARSIAR